MNTRVQSRESASQNELLKHANFEPVFDQDGNIVDIRELKISTDQRAGKTAMRELFETQEKDDHMIGVDGWSRKQRRLLSTPAPLAAHYLRHSQKWDARTGMMRDAALILLPVEVIWSLFELLFEGQYSVKIVETAQEDEEVVPVGTNHRGDAAQDAPGRRFYARAVVRLSIHLPGQAVPREFEGVGVSYGQLHTEKTGNIFAINSERRTVDKGAIADAKREALSNIGPVFRRAFEDGDEMVEHIERLLLDKVQEMNRPAIHRRKASDEPVPAPKPRKANSTATQPHTQIAPVTTTDDTSDEPTQARSEEKLQKPEKPQPDAQPAKPRQTQSSVSQAATDTPKPDAGTPAAVAKVSLRIPGSPERMVRADIIEEAFIDIVFETCTEAGAARKLVELNKAILVQYGVDMTAIENVIGELDDQPEDEIPDFGFPDQDIDRDASVNARIDVQGKSGKAVLAEMLAALDKAKSSAEINGIIKVNGEAVRKMTPKQMTQFSEYRMKRVSNLTV